MPPTTLPVVSLSLEDRIANLENLCGVGAVDSVPCAAFDANDTIFPPLKFWRGSPPCIGLVSSGAGVFPLAPASEYLGSSFTIFALTPYTHTIAGELIVDGVLVTDATFDGQAGSSVTLFATPAGWEAIQAFGITFGI